jgi:ABC-2 type transport system permease protein
MTATATRPATRAPVAGTAPLAGMGTLLRFMLRRDRVRLPLWVGGIAGITAIVAAAFPGLYGTEQERQALAQTMDSPAAIAMTGQNHAGVADYTIGAMMGQQMLWFTALAVGLMSVFLVVRHTRTEEATGRAELVRAAVVGRHAGTAAALALIAVANVAVAALTAVLLGALGVESIDWAGSALYGAAHAAVGMTFAGVAVIAVQISEHARGAAGIGVAAVGLAYILRAIGDVGAGALSWLSPIGWAQATAVYVGNRWWPLLLAVAVTPALVAAGVALSTRRDVGAGLKAPRRGRATGSRGLTTALGSALRLQRANLVGWVVALFVLGLMYGSVLGDAEQWFAEIEALGEMLPETEVSVVEAFAGLVTMIMAVIAGAYTIMAAQKGRSEESAGRAEPLLATGLSRTRWLGSHIVIVLAGSALVLLAGALGLGAAGAAATADADLLPRLLLAALGYLPALWVVAGVVIVLFGLVPRAIPAAWAVIVYSFLVLYLGAFLDFPEWMAGLSPFGHVAQYPAEDMAVLPLVALTLVAGALIAAGLAAFRRRDLQSPT